MYKSGNKPGHAPMTQAFINMMDSDPALKAMMEESIRKAAAINPDSATNPCLTLDSMYEFMDWSAACMPWAVLKDKAYSSLYDCLDQGVDYIWFVFDQPLDELRDKGYFYPSLQYHEPVASWLKNYVASWGTFLSTPESWNEDYHRIFVEDGTFGLTEGWYEEPSGWHSFNDFFSRRLADPSRRPVASAPVVAPADSVPQGLWKIDDSGNVVLDNPLVLKSARLTSVRDLLGEGSAFGEAFSGGSLTHTFLGVNDYHRYHAPVDGKIVELRKIPGINAAGGVTVWDKEKERYVLDTEIGFQMIETRDCAVLETEEFGYVAMLPIGMSQICSCNWEPGLQVGKTVRRGDGMGYFLFGGSDIVLLFQRGVDVNMIVPAFSHIMMGQAYAELSRGK